LGQFAVHTVAILAATDTALSFADPYDPSFIPDGSFNPNSLNTCTFLLTALASVNTFAVNYRGRPFTADLRSNQLLYRTLQVCYGILFACAFEVFPPLNELLQLAPLPSAHAEILDYAFSKRSVSTVNSLLLQMVQTLEFPAFLTLLMLVDTIAVFGLERSVVASFEGRGKT
jgi:cation-transporting ATPase 13A1